MLLRKSLRRMTAFAKEAVQMLDEILGIIADVIFGRLFKRWENGQKWNVLSVFAAVAVVGGHNGHLLYLQSFTATR